MVNRSFVSRLLPLLALACALAACGRRGPLQPPPGSTPPPRAQSSLVAPGDQANTTRPSLTRDTLGNQDPAREQVLAPTTPVTVPKTAFFLDPLL